MIEQPQQQQKWHEDSILFKSGIIALIILALLIPSSWIQSLITDREGYQQMQLDGVTNNWSGPQLIQGPVLMLPYKKLLTETGTDGKAVTREVAKVLYVLPQKLKMKAGVKTELFTSGIYDAIVYNSGILVEGNFNQPDLNELGIDPNLILYDKAKLVFSISDLKGLKNNPAVTIDAQTYTPEPATDGNIPFNTGLEVNFPLQKDKGFTFSYLLDLKGSNELNFLHTGKITDVQVNSDWKNPGFNGRYLPDSRTTTDKGFGAKWHMLYYNRPFPQQWADDKTVLTNFNKSKQATIGVKLHLPIDQYRKILRTAKYSSLIIILTFISLFLTELIKKQKIHLFNYALIGAAMVVYYTLLLSFSEQLGYNWAYLIASVSTILLIS
ncbi:MAG: cell envelope integrity protein CreD, partial [Mucilaginibacter sp.]|nr:cell envelope integrity protein CreD [Mucilaginibacter sp.]